MTLPLDLTGAGAVTTAPASAPALVSVLGLDLSLTGTGLAIDGQAWTFAPKKLRGIPRMRAIGTEVRRAVDEHSVTTVVVEGPSYGSQGSGTHERAGLWWLVANMLADRISYLVASPSTVKKYATGVGGGPKAGKDMVLGECVRRFPWFTGDNNAADATWLCAIGHAHLGQPIVTVPATHTAALKGVEVFV